MNADERRFLLTRAILIVTLCAALPACGRKADPQPGELVRPKSVTTLSGDLAKEGVRLEWVRPGEYVNGKRMDDLGGFLVFRGLPGQEAEQIADLPVSDRERFQREKKFSYLDRTAAKGQTYYYRVISYTTDRYYSAPSNQVDAIVSP